VLLPEAAVLDYMAQILLALLYVSRGWGRGGRECVCVRPVAASRAHDLTSAAVPARPHHARPHCSATSAGCSTGTSRYAAGVWRARVVRS
jgi:hypothetical protein